MQHQLMHDVREHIMVSAAKKEREHANLAG